MRFLVDECTGPAVAAWLRTQGHDVVSVYEESPGVGDEHVLNRAFSEGRILVTVDKDFGEKVFRDRLQHCGIVLLRLADLRPANKVNAIERLLTAFADELSSRFIVVSETQVRFAQR